MTHSQTCTLVADSRYVADEWLAEGAHNEQPVKQRRAGWAAQLQERHITDFRQWKDHDAYRTAFARLLRDLKATPDWVWIVGYIRRDIDQQEGGRGGTVDHRAADAQEHLRRPLRLVRDAAGPANP